MDENFLTEGTFQSSMDEIMEKRFGGKYTLEDVGEMVEFTEMALEERMNIVATEITNDFAELSKSLDDIQKSLYDMFGLLVDSQADLTKSSERGGITDADVKKIVDGLQLEEKFFPHLYQYLDERFGLDAEKIKNFRERTASVIGASEDEGDEREGRTQSTADINRRTDRNPSKKSTTVGRRAFEDQNVFNNRLRLWTEGHKEPSSQKSDEKSKKDKSDDESLISKIIKVGMIAGMIMEILAKSPTITQFFTEKIKGLWDELNKEGGVIDKIKGGLWSGFVSLWNETIQPWLSEKFQLGKEWFKENFPELYETLSYITQLVVGAYYAQMTKEQQESYAKEHPGSDLDLWMRGTDNSRLDFHDIFQFATATSGKSGDFIRGLDERGQYGKIGSLEKFADSQDFSNYDSINYIDSVYQRNLSPYDFSKFLSLYDIPDSFAVAGTSWYDKPFIKMLLEHGATQSKENNIFKVSNVHEALKKYTEDAEVRHSQFESATSTIAEVKAGIEEKTKKGEKLTESERQMQDLMEEPFVPEETKGILLEKQIRDQQELERKKQGLSAGHFFDVSPEQAKRESNAQIVYNILTVKEVQLPSFGKKPPIIPGSLTSTGDE